MIRAYLNQTAVIVSPPPVDSWGEPNGTGAETSVQCKARFRSRLVRSMAGEDVLAVGSILVLDKPDHTDKIRIDGDEWPILAIHSADGWRAQFYEVFFG